MSAGSPQLSFVEQAPEPGRFWIRYRPRRWPGARGFWIDLARLRPGACGAGPLEAPRRAPDDLVYLPPVEGEREAERLRLLEHLLRTGVPVLLQQLPELAPPIAGALTVVDLAPALLAGRPQSLARLPSGAVAAWPLIAGRTDAEELREAGLAALAAAGIAAVVPLRPELSPRQRRRLAREGGEEAFRALFHGPPPSLRDFARAARRHGLGYLIERPEAPGPPRRAGNRRAAGHLALIGDLWLRLGRPEAEGQRFLRAARWIERERHDMLRMAREGHLEVVDWLDDASRAELGELAQRGRTALREELEREYA